ncbi:hypothetical protein CHINAEXTREME_07120 [Halobiforma lacisalsi AJ5]|uniref:Uncharacterized protein n=1 Tax=Natronobacterium lacisalsi AJ5 TaxID=358396 RepID=M0LXK6_NATLA|nr:hypothetical protein [Halobiforma lacisalsi]APW97559.1 hypothetical protein CHINAEXTREME_07120 [Halobiforma lacisalsi AJ5]EMA37059.1 hypothetical protein C445_02426 [Halobiforma lacisalsi AJ5]
MVLRCSLLGHDYGDPDVEREREERGSEVVVTVQEYEECTRCGERNVISENTEVTSISSAIDGDELPDEHEPEPESVPEPGPESDIDSEQPSGSEPESAADGEDVEFIDADAGETETVEPTADADTDADDTVATAADDDGEILEDSPADRDRDSDREHGEWPDSSDVGPPVEEENPTEWPEAEVGDPTDDDAVVLEHDSSETGVPDGVDRGVSEGDVGTAAGGTGGSDGISAADVTADLEAMEDDDSSEEPALESGSGIERDGSVPVPTEEDPADEDVPTEFYCPRCDYVAAENRASLRAGDICPDCRKGYLGERPRH